MPIAQSAISLPIAPRQLAQSLVAWLNRSRVPAIFKAKDELDGLSPRACRERLCQYADSWIAAEYLLTRWPMREGFEQTLRYATVELVPSTNKPVRTVIKWRYPQLDYAATGAGDDYVPPTRATAMAEAEERDRTEEEILQSGGYERAAEIFLALITGPYYNRIGRCARCSRYFLNVSGHRNKRFCSARCARIESAVKSKRERDQRECQRRLDRVQRVVGRFSRLSAGRQQEIADLTAWLSKEAGVSRHFVTRAINKGLLKGVTK